MSSPDTKHLERIERLLNYVVYLLIFEAALTVAVAYLLQQFIMSLTP
jgi:hypothetical protein